MSDINGSAPIPKAVQSVSHGTDKASGISRDKQQTDTQTREEDGRGQKKTQQQEAAQGRDPAVSISASAAHLHVGEKLKQKVAQVDPEGRPIIETETATFALRPDAGLKAGDDVTLVVKDAGKQLAADLLLRNGAVIDPPVRLNLIVIALHSVEPNVPSQTIDRPNVTPNYKPVTNFSGPTVSITETTEAETLARVLAHTKSNSYSTAQASPAVDSGKFTETVQNPANLAALITAQQSSSNNTAQAGQSNPLVPPVPGQTPTINNHLIPPSTLTEVTAPNTSQTSPVGLGSPIPAIALSGKSVTFQVLDPSVSKVSPAEVASVISVKPLASSDAKALPVAASALGNGNALAHVETNKGAYVINQAAASALSGELVRISGAVQAAIPTIDKELPVYTAKLHSTHVQRPQTVQVQIAANESQQNSQSSTTVTAVHIVRAFLTPDGPKSDVRLETPLGDLSLTLPNNVRPTAGAAVTVLPQAQVAEQVALQVSSTVAANIPPVSVSQWPSFEQAYDLLQSVAPAGAEALQSMTARTAQGGPKLANSAMFLLSALGGGQKANWLGQTAEAALAKRNPNLLDLLKEDVSRLFNIASDTSGEWRALLLPFDAKNQDMPMLAFLFNQGGLVDPDQHNKGQNPEEDKQDEEKRFVLEVQFSVLGAIQLDGSIKGNRFDLMVRSQTQFSPSLTQDTSELFSNALAAGAFTGSLGFSVEETFPVDVNAVLEKMSPDEQPQLA